MWYCFIFNLFFAFQADLSFWTSPAACVTSLAFAYCLLSTFSNMVSFSHNLDCFVVVVVHDELSYSCLQENLVLLELVLYLLLLENLLLLYPFFRLLLILLFCHSLCLIFILPWRHLIFYLSIMGWHFYCIYSKHEFLIV